MLQHQCQHIHRLRWLLENGPWGSVGHSGEGSQPACQHLPHTEDLQTDPFLQQVPRGWSRMARGHSPKGRLWGPRVGEPSDKISEGAEDSIPAPKFSGKGSVTLLQPKLFLVLSSCPQTFLECPYTLWHRCAGHCAGCWAPRGTGHHTGQAPCPLWPGGVGLLWVLPQTGGSRSWAGYFQVWRPWVWSSVRPVRRRIGRRS